MWTSREFFRTMVEPSVNDFLERRGDLRLGFFAAIVLNQMADYWAHDGHTSTAKQARDQLSAKCQSFKIINDVCDVSKHAKLTRTNRRLTTIDQVKTPPGLFQAPFGTGVFAEAWIVSVTLDDGTVYPLYEIVVTVFELWRALLVNSPANTAAR